MPASPAPSLEPADDADLPAIRELLTDAQLPIADLTETGPVRFWLMRDGESLIATVGLERYGNVAMLRSLVVRADHRGKGLGNAVLRQAEQQAITEGIRELCVLTTSAAALFARHGYDRIDRDDAPTVVQRSEEFRSLCPDSAICMIKRLPSR